MKSEEIFSGANQGQKSIAVIDVRSPMEFAGGHVPGSLNIPLNEIHLRLDEIKKISHAIVLCCASGMRSGMAAAYLGGQGIKCLNGGSWMDVQYEFKIK